MDDASAELQSRCFSDATCQRLTHLLLRSSTLEGNSNAPAWVVEEISALRRSDQQFSNWYETKLSTSRACEPSVSEAPQLVVDGANNRSTIDLLIRGLVADRTWLSTSDQEAAVRMAPPILLEVAHVVLRLRAFEQQFNSELQARLQPLLYNFAYGLSHELNNPLANIATRAGVLAQAETRKQPLALLHAIVDNAMRGCEMLGDLMLIARPPAMEPVNVEVLPFLQAIVEKASRWVTLRGVTVEYQARDIQTSTQAPIDPNAITEALWALIRNGVEAMPDGGRLSICTSIDSISNDEESTPTCWLIEVSDEGSGLSSEALTHCFDPFYSGREAGRGLGVGLTKARRLVSLHGGRLTIGNRPDGCGCRAVVQLPLT